FEFKGDKTDAWMLCVRRSEVEPSRLDHLSLRHLFLFDKDHVTDSTGARQQKLDVVLIVLSYVFDLLLLAFGVRVGLDWKRETLLTFCIGVRQRVEALGDGALRLFCPCPRILFLAELMEYVETSHGQNRRAAAWKVWLGGCEVSFDHQLEIAAVPHENLHRV